MQLYVYTLEKTLYEGETDSAILPAESGEIGILPHHVPLATALHKGTLSFNQGEEKKTLDIEGGFAYTDGEHLIVLAD